MTETEETDMKKVNIKEGVVINLNNEEVTITEVMKNIGFYYKNKSGEVKFCNTMFETLNFEPVFESLLNQDFKAKNGGVRMACYFVIKKENNKVVDIGTSVSYSTHDNIKVAHVYHPIINCDVPGFCYWDVSSYEIYCDDGLCYSDVLKKYKLCGDIGSGIKYHKEIKRANLYFSNNGICKQ